jgi:hypothetical protein
MSAILRFLELVRRELEAADVRGELGGLDPSEPHKIWAVMPSGLRVVAIFDAPPADPNGKRERLQTLLDSFASLAPPLETPSVSPLAKTAHELDDALVALTQRARATAALVIDDTSPVIWGNSLVPHGPEDVDEAMWVARIAQAAAARGTSLPELVALDEAAMRVALGDDSELGRDVERIRELGVRAMDRAHVFAMRAVATTREHEGKALPVASDVPLMVRHFANIYRLIVVFEGPFSELHAESAIIHALPVIERLVTSLPPRARSR